MSANPYFIDTEDNPNEVFGVRACSFSGQQKHSDCAGKWRTWHTINVANTRAPKFTVCEFHLKAGTSDLFVTPKVREVKPPRARRAAPEVVAL